MGFTNPGFQPVGDPNDIDEIRDRLEYEKFLASQYKFENRKLKETNEQLTNGLRDNEKIIKQMKLITNMLKKNERNQEQDRGSSRQRVESLEFQQLQEQLREKTAQYDTLKKVMLDEENDRSRSNAQFQEKVLDNRNVVIEKEMVIQSQKTEIESAKRDVSNLKKLLNEQIKANYQTEVDFDQVKDLSQLKINVQDFRNKPDSSQQPRSERQQAQAVEALGSHEAVQAASAAKESARRAQESARRAKEEKAQLAKELEDARADLALARDAVRIRGDAVKSLRKETADRQAALEEKVKAAEVAVDLANKE